LTELEETLRAIKDGTVDAFVVGEGDSQRIYTLESADRPFRLFVENMQQGAATLYADGTIAYSNQQLAELLKTSYSELVGANLRSFVASEGYPIYDALLSDGEKGGVGEVYLKSSSGDRIPVLLAFNQMPKDCGAALGVLVTDLTTEKYHEELAAAHEALRKKRSRDQTTGRPTVRAA
jgi:PAS domain S-box-containing protein